MQAIFISYRRDDSEGEAGRLFDDLVERFGEDSVFMDVAAIEPGRDFRKAIDESVATCGVLLAIVGREWTAATNEAGQRRLDDPLDFVRLETASALKRDIPVIPVLVHGAKMPRVDQLPDDLKEFAYRNGVELTHARWTSDLQLLIKALRAHVDGPNKAGAGRPPSAAATEANVPAVAVPTRSRRKKILVTVGLLMAAVALAVGGLMAKAAGSRRAEEKTAALRAEQRVVAEKAERERIEAQRIADETAAADKMAEQKAQAEQAERDRLEAKRIADEKIAAEQRALADRTERERLEAKRIADAAEAAKQQEILAKAERDRQAKILADEEAAKQRTIAEKAIKDAAIRDAAIKERQQRIADDKAAAAKRAAEEKKRADDAARKLAAEQAERKRLEDQQARDQKIAEEQAAKDRAAAQAAAVAAGLLTHLFDKGSHPPGEGPTSDGGPRYAKRVPGKPGYVYSPYGQNVMINVGGAQHGEIMRDPQSGKPFRVP